MNRTTRRRYWPAMALAATLLISLFALAAADGGVGVDSVELAYVSVKAAGTTEDGISYGTNDILITDGSWWDIYFEGDDYGLESGKHKITAVDRPYQYWWADTNVDTPEVGPDDSYFYEEIYMTFDTANVALPSYYPGTARGEDIVGFWRDEYYDAFNDLWYYGHGFFPAVDGSDIGLTTQDERIDGLYFFPLYSLTGADAEFAAQNGCEAWAWISTHGAYRVPYAYGGTLKGTGEDVLELCIVAWEWWYGVTEAYWVGQWDNSELGVPKNSIIAIDFDEEAWDGSYYFLTKGQFNVPNAVGGHSMIFRWDNWNWWFDDELHDFNGEYPRLNGTAVGLDLAYSFTCSATADC